MAVNEYSDLIERGARTGGAIDVTEHSHIFRQMRDEEPLSMCCGAAIDGDLCTACKDHTEPYSEEN